MGDLFGDQTNLILGIGALAVIGVGGSLYALFSQVFAADARRQKRIAALSPAGDKNQALVKQKLQAAAQRDVANKIKDLSETEKKSRQIENRLAQAGMKMTATSFLSIFYGIAFAAAAGIFLFLQDGLLAAGVGGVIAIGMPRFVLGKMVARRQRKFLENLANAIDILVRGVRSGLPVNEGLRVIANEIPDPVKSEFQLLIDSAAVGIPLEDALGKMHDRIPLAEVNFFRTVLAIQKSTGGNLAEALSNLSTILRERKKLKGKIRALSAEARMSAYIIGALPFIVGTVVYLMSPDYMSLLFTEDMGIMMLVGGLFWMSIGVLMMRSMIKFDM